MHVRLSVKAIIIQDGRLLVLKNQDEAGDWYSLPGGGQDHGETIPAALNRECLEEIGARVTVGRLRFLRDYIASHHEFADTDGGFHQVELMFACELRDAPRAGSLPDGMQTGIAWLALDALGGHRLYPGVLKRLLAAQDSHDTPVYLGDVN